MNYEFERTRALAIKGAANKVLNLARKADLNAGAVNWGDLSVHDVRLVVDVLDRNECRYIIDIQEASPDCNLYEFVYKKLAQEGFEDVELDFSW